MKNQVLSHTFSFLGSFVVTGVIASFAGEAVGFSTGGAFLLGVFAHNRLASFFFDKLDH